MCCVTWSSIILYDKILKILVLFSVGLNLKIPNPELPEPSENPTSNRSNLGSSFKTKPLESPKKLNHTEPRTEPGSTQPYLCDNWLYYLVLYTQWNNQKINCYGIGEPWILEILLSLNLLSGCVICHNKRKSQYYQAKAVIYLLVARFLKKSRLAFSFYQFCRRLSLSEKKWEWFFSRQTTTASQKGRNLALQTSHHFLSESFCWYFILWLRRV